MVEKNGKSYQPSKMTIVDPIDGTNDTSSGSHQIDKVKDCFTEAHKVLHKAVYVGEKIVNDQTFHR